MSMFRHRIGSPGMVLAALVALGSGAAQAAPQALALVATKGKVGLACAAPGPSATRAARTMPADPMRCQLRCPIR